MNKDFYNEVDREDDNFDFDAIKRKYRHLTVEELDKEFEEFKQNLLRRWSDEDSQK